MAMATDLAKEFRGDHRYVVRSLLTLEKLLESRDIAHARKLVDDLDKAVGPHFKFEEEDLYPALSRFVGEDRVRQLISDHDGAVKVVRNLKDLLKGTSLTDEEMVQAKKELTAFFVHASDCDGLTVLAEELPETVQASLAEKLYRFREWGVPLTEWKN